MKKEIVKHFILSSLMSYSGYKMVAAINSLNNFMMITVSKSSMILDPIKQVDYYFVLKYNELLIARFEWTIIFEFFL